MPECTHDDDAFLLFVSLSKPERCLLCIFRPVFFVCAFGLGFALVFRRDFEVITLSRQFDINHATSDTPSTERGGGIG